MFPPHFRFLAFAFVCALLVAGAPAASSADESRLDAPVSAAEIAAAKQRSQDFLRKIHLLLERCLRTKSDGLADVLYEREGRWLARHYFAYDLVAGDRLAPPSYPAHHAIDSR